ncbi:2-dehydro-3-deoxygalactonokinase [Cyclobacterium xiamenense]|uniref:2-dehydro-3-deoxygalactonokinase n=1 Tax=Cyclobacterium xiamenense TaxID=1297121 RepID=UPI0035D019BF
MIQFLSCDWGTSSFRLRLVRVEDMRIIGEYLSEMGVQQANRDYLNAKDSSGRTFFYRKLIKKAVRSLESELHLDLAQTMIICSGMASSSIGIDELPYAELPFPVDGSRMNIQFYRPTEEMDHPLFLLSGVKSESDVMRGEETQLIGIILQLKNFDGSGVFVFPGTHSKHITVSKQVVTDFQTYMTGEVFWLMSRSSILSKSVSEGEENGDASELAFIEGVRVGAKNNLLGSLFQVRTNDLFGKLVQNDNFHFLSGLLIGNELCNLVRNERRPVFLCAEGPLHYWYAKALEILRVEAKVLSPQEVRQAVVYGQFEIVNDTINHEKSIFLGSF